MQTVILVVAVSCQISRIPVSAEHAMLSSIKRHADTELMEMSVMTSGETSVENQRNYLSLKNHACTALERCV